MTQPQHRGFYSNMTAVRPRWNTPATQQRFNTVAQQNARQTVPSRPITGAPSTQPRMQTSVPARPPMPQGGQAMPRPSYKYAAAVRSQPQAAPPAQQVCSAENPPFFCSSMMYFQCFPTICIVAITVTFLISVRLVRKMSWIAVLAVCS